MPVKRVDRLNVPEPTGFSALVLAGGAGRRFGGAKLTTPFRGGVLLDGALRAAFAAPVDEIIVVTGSDPKVAPAAEAFSRARGQGARLRTMRAPGWSDGLSASLRAGLAVVSPHSRGAFIFLGDMPNIPSGLAQRLAHALDPGVVAVAPVLEDEPGHPALLGVELFPAAMRLTGDRGARALMESQGERFVRLAVQDRGVLFDVDTREALHAIGTG
ncbi:NTP transferase domain-containing protein [Caulobacter sp. S45]|uniref:nucleotidyltransferase family protein n=1 Tax=Caulobacter sp. S45 TaxID=1641861 RepID=UPI001575783E|nr:NTP transferase domain-containing protein [Caulobacter sp. S45]